MWQVFIRDAASSDDLRGLQAIQAGHHDVDEKHGELTIENSAQGFVSRRRPHEVAAERFEHGLEHQEIRGNVIDEKDARTRRGSSVERDRLCVLARNSAPVRLAGRSELDDLVCRHHWQQTGTVLR
jgi:hypothetical protein